MPKKKKKMTLAEQLNKDNVFAEIKKSQVCLSIPRRFDTNTHCWEDYVPYHISGHGYVDPHPAGSDRCGYVPFWRRDNEVAFYMELQGEWEDNSSDCEECNHNWSCTDGSEDDILDDLRSPVECTNCGLTGTVFHVFYKLEDKDGNILIKGVDYDKISETPN